MYQSVSYSASRFRYLPLTTPSAALGFLVTLYATLITLFGLAWVLFLIGT